MNFANGNSAAVIVYSRVRCLQGMGTVALMLEQVELRLEL
jgi:hypothetical protein